ncbi:MAG TPA: ACT domain-containing protein [Polyangiaceae bacterium]|nr:ACT domain-containing protein [Polyangiaceae bacterium]
MKARYLVLTAVGTDRPGLVKQISAMIHEARANLEDSRMAILGGDFALILLVSGEESAVAAVERQSRELGQKLGLEIITRETAQPSEPKSYLPYRIRVTGVDHPGIVHAITDILARRGVNVASLESHLAYAPLSGTPMFVLEAELQLPGEVALAALRRDLASACEEDNLDFVLEARRG